MSSKKTGKPGTEARPGTTPYVSLADERLGVDPSGKGLSLADLPDAIDEAVACGGYGEGVRAAATAATNHLRRFLRGFGEESGRGQ